MVESTSSMFSDPLHCEYYELNVIDIEDIFIIGRRIYVPNKRAGYLGIKWYSQMKLGVVDEVHLPPSEIQNRIKTREVLKDTRGRYLEVYKSTSTRQPPCTSSQDVAF